MLGQYKLMIHLAALKRFLLLGQGDFIQCLMDALVPELSKRASRLFRHNLLAHVDGAVRSSNAQYFDPVVLEQLDVKILKGSPGDDGWKVFTLNYQVRAPLNAVLHETAMANYLQMFRFLWRLKRVSHATSSLWERTVKTNDVLDGLPGVGPVRHRCQLLRHEMQHFVSNLMSYSMFEVLESSWEVLQRAIAEAADLDAVIAAHDEYQRYIMEATLLGPGEDEERLRKMLHNLFDVVLRFCEMQQHFITAGLEIAHQRDLHAQRIYERTQEGMWGVVEGDEAALPNIELKGMQLAENVAEQYSVISKAFVSKLNEFISLVDEVGHALGQNNLRFLTVRLDFNKFYEPARRKGLPPIKGGSPPTVARFKGSPLRSPRH
jgi:gamma-tubulin complex component 3